MATGCILQVAATLIAVCLVLRTTLCMEPGPSGLNSNNGDNYNNGIQEMLESMDRTVDPCENFYYYACGSWLRKHPIPYGLKKIDKALLIRQQLSNKLIDLLGEPIEGSDDDTAAKAKTLYQSCMNEKLVNKRGSEPLIKLLKSKFGGWPLLGSLTDTAGPSSAAAGGDPTKSPMDWARLMGILRTYNNEIIIGQKVDVDKDDPSKHIIRLYPAGLGLPLTEYYQPSSPQFRAYQIYFLKTAHLLNANNANLMSDIGDILKFETGLADIVKQYHDLGSQSFIHTNIAVLQVVTKAIDWDIYLEHAFPGMQDLKLQKIQLYGLDMFKAISDLIDRTANNTTVVNYLLWQFVMKRVHNLGSKFANIKREFEAAIYGTKPSLPVAPRNIVCLDFVESKMTMALGMMYIRRHFAGEPSLEAHTMVTNIRQTFSEILREVDWMDDATRSEAIRKANTIAEQIGYPRRISGPNKLDEEYQDLNFDPYSYFENVMQVFLSDAKANRSKLGQEPNKLDGTEFSPLAIKAYYSLPRNLISLPAAIWHTPHFHVNHPKSLNYGSLGFFIGHELSHGFANGGKFYDHQGNNKLWWSPNTTRWFKDRAQCLIDQYSQYRVKLVDLIIDVDGYRTLSENIADNAGIKAAFRAYRRFELLNRPENPVPGVEFTHDQMFFIKFAQSWCQNPTPDFLADTLNYESHSPHIFRVSGAVSNMEEFSDAFKCRVGSKMNPVKKCKVW